MKAVRFCVHFSACFWITSTLAQNPEISSQFVTNQRFYNPSLAPYGVKSELTSYFSFVESEEVLYFDSRLSLYDRSNRLEGSLGGCSWYNATLRRRESGYKQNYSRPITPDANWYYGVELGFVMRWYPEDGVREQPYNSTIRNEYLSQVRLSSGLGLSYQSDDLMVGIAMQNLTSPRFNYLIDELPRSFNLMAEYVIRWSDKYLLKPALMMVYVNQEKWASPALKLEVDGFYQAGAVYHKHLNRMGLNAGWQTGPMVVTYSYEFYLGERQDLTLATHQGSIVLMFGEY